LKKKWKIIFAVFLVLAIGGAGALYYSFTAKKYDISQDKEVKKIVDSDYNVALPEDAEKGQNNNDHNAASNQTQTAAAKEQEETTDETSTENGTGTTIKTNKTDKQTNENTSPTQQEKITADSIKEKYRPSFASLQQQANAKINALIAHAFAEYQAKKANNEKISFSQFYSKYNTAAKELEAKTDAAFETIYHALEADLKKHGFSTSYAQEFRDAYEQEKKNRRSALIKKAIEKL
jgi:hypothetical protein